MANWESTIKFLQEYLPMLLQQKFQQQYIDYRTKADLENYTKSQEIYGQTQSDIQQRALMNQMFENLMGAAKEDYKDSPYSFNKIQETFKGFMPEEMTAGMETPENFPQLYEDAEQALTQIIAAMNSGQQPSNELILKLVKAFGEGVPTDLVSNIEKFSGERADRGIRGEELTEAIESRKLREKEVALRGEEAKGGGSPTQKQTKIDSYEKEIFTLMEKLHTGEPEKTEHGKEQKQIQMQRVMELAEKTRKLRDAIGETVPENYKAAIDQLKASGFKKRDLIENKELISGLINDGYSISILLEYY